ncbi:MAG: hypothetical protein HQK55_15125 [Deltaproteobacteria bacterium]|nr:hypothetical protein [Deltaproteobacteria bacterium]
MSHFMTLDPMEKDSAHVMTPGPETAPRADMNRMQTGPGASGDPDSGPADLARKVNPRFASRLKSRLNRL